MGGTATQGEWMGSPNTSGEVQPVPAGLQITFRLYLCSLHSQYLCWLM